MTDKYIKLLAESVAKPYLKRQQLKSFVSQLTDDTKLIEAVVGGAALIESRTQDPGISEYLDRIGGEPKSNHPDRLTRLQNEKRYTEIYDDVHAEFEADVQSALLKAKKDKRYSTYLIKLIVDAIDNYIASMEDQLNQVSGYTIRSDGGQQESEFKSGEIDELLEDQDLINFAYAIERNRGAGLIDAITNVLSKISMAIFNGNIDDTYTSTLGDLSSYINTAIMNEMRVELQKSRKPTVSGTEGYSANDIANVLTNTSKLNEVGQRVYRTRQGKNPANRIVYKLIEEYPSNDLFIKELESWSNNGADYIPDKKYWQEDGTSYSTKSQAQDIIQWNEYNYHQVGATGLNRPIVQYKSKNYRLNEDALSEFDPDTFFRDQDNYIDNAVSFLIEMNPEYSDLLDELNDKLDEDRKYAIKVTGNEDIAKLSDEEYDDLSWNIYTDYVTKSLKDYMVKNKYLPDFLNTKTPDNSPFWVEESEKRFEVDLHDEADVKDSEAALSVEQPKESKLDTIIDDKLGDVSDINSTKHFTSDKPADKGSVDGALAVNKSTSKNDPNSHKSDESMREYIKIILEILSGSSDSSNKMKEIMIEILLHNGLGSDKSPEEARKLAKSFVNSLGKKKVHSISSSMGRFIKNIATHPKFYDLFEEIMENSDIEVDLDTLKKKI